MESYGRQPSSVEDGTLNEMKFYTVNSRHTLFFRASASCSKILNVRSVFNAVKIFRESASYQKS